MHEVIFIESNTEKKPNDSEWGIEFENDEDRERFETLKQKYDENVRGVIRGNQYQSGIRHAMFNYLSEKELTYETAAEIMGCKKYNVKAWNYDYNGGFKPDLPKPKKREPYETTEEGVISVCEFITAAKRTIRDSNYNGKTKNLRKRLDPGYTEKKDF